MLTFGTSPSPASAMVDEETRSLWSIEGEAMTGPLRGRRLTPLDGYSVEWHVFSAYHPRADLLAMKDRSAQARRPGRCFPGPHPGGCAGGCPAGADARG